LAPLRYADTPCLFCPVTNRPPAVVRGHRSVTKRVFQIP
jgi:hypothetical protein